MNEDPAGRTSHPGERRWNVIVTPRSIDLAGLGLDRELAVGGCEVQRVEGGPLRADRLAQVWADADAAILGVDIVDEAALAAAPSLKVISRYGVGYDTIDVGAATARDVLVTITASAPSVAVAEFTIALMLSLIRQLPRYALDPSARLLSPIPRQLASMTLGLIGLGRIGREVAQRASALGMRVWYFDPAVRDAPTSLGQKERRDIDTLLSGADVISLHVPITPETRGMLGRDRIARMKHGAYLINVARGGLVDEEALAESLRRGSLAGAALDVREIEPSPPSDPLRSAPNLILTPHIASMTVQATEQMAREAVANLLLAKHGGSPAAVNPEVLERWRARRVDPASGLFDSTPR